MVQSRREGLADSDIINPTSISKYILRKNKVKKYLKQSITVQAYRAINTKHYFSTRLVSGQLDIESAKFNVPS